MATRTCADIENDIISRNKQLEIWRPELEILINNGNSGDLGAIQTLRALITDLNSELLKLKAEQRMLNCLIGGPIEIPQDNQTVISTSSVRKKDYTQ